MKKTALYLIISIIILGGCSNHHISSEAKNINKKELGIQLDKSTTTRKRSPRGYTEMCKNYWRNESDEYYVGFYCDKEKYCNEIGLITKKGTVGYTNDINGWKEFCK